MDGANIRAHRQALIEHGRSMGDTRAATALFLLGVAGRQTYESVDPGLRKRLLLNGDVLLNIEMTPYLEYEPTAAELASVRLPRLVTAGAENRDTTAAGHWRYQARPISPPSSPPLSPNCRAPTWPTSASRACSPKHCART